jgi:hypothetical protein
MSLISESTRVLANDNAISRKDSAIGYEASNQYYYRPLDLVEKVINCQQVIEDLRTV